MANPWEMNWASEPVDEKKKASGKNPWDMDWEVPKEQAPEAQGPDLKPLGAQKERPHYHGAILPFSRDKDGLHFDSDAGLIGALKRSFMLPGDAMAGKVDPTSEEGIGRAFEFAGTFGAPGLAGAKVVEPVAAEVAPKVARPFAPIRNSVIGEIDDPALIRQRLDDLRAVGVENPTVGMVSGSEKAALKEHALAPNSRTLQAAQASSVDAVPNAITSAADRMASATNPTARPLSKAELSQALLDQAEKVKQAQVAKANELYGKVGELTGEQPAVGDASRAALDSLRKHYDSLSNSQKLTEGAQVREAIKHGEAIVADLDQGARFNTLKQTRTSLGSLTSDRNLNPVLKGHLNTFRQALSDDMAATAKSTSGDAFNAWKTADDFYRRHKDTSTGFGKGSDVSALMNKNADTAYDFVLGKSKEGAERIRNIKGQLIQEGGDEAWDRFKGTTTLRMATDKVGNVDGSTFVRNFRQIAPEAKDEIWGPVGSSHRDSLETIARAAETMKAYASKANHSNTANHQAVRGDIMPTRDSLLWAAVGGVKAFAGAAAIKAANAASRGYQAKLLANPKTAEWLANIGRAPLQKGGLTRHVDELVQFGKDTQDPQLRLAINEYLNAAGIERQKDDY